MQPIASFFLNFFIIVAFAHANDIIGVAIDLILKGLNFNLQGKTSTEKRF